MNARLPPLGPILVDSKGESSKRESGTGEKKEFI